MTKSMAAGRRIVETVVFMALGLVTLALLAAFFVFLVIPFLVITAALILLGLVLGWFSPSRRRRATGWQPPGDVVDVTPLLALPPSEGWPMAGGDPQRSRRTSSPGPRHGRVVWSWTPVGPDPRVHEPLVTADGSAIVVLAESRGRSAISVLSPAGALQREILLPHPPWSEPHLGPSGLLYAASWQFLMAYSGDGELLWKEELAGYVRELRPTPSGGLLLRTKEQGFDTYSTAGQPQGPRYPDLDSWHGELVLTFDRSGNLYAAESESWRGGPDDQAEQFRRIAAFDVQGLRRWERNLTAADATHEPEYTVRHIWGLEDSAVFFGDRKIQAYSAGGDLLWEIAGVKDFERIVEVPDLKLSLALDRRLAGGPLLVAAGERGWEYLDAAVDGAGNSYVCRPFAVAALDPALRLLWTAKVEKEYLYHPVIGPQETVLVAGYGSIYAIA